MSQVKKRENHYLKGNSWVGRDECRSTTPIRNRIGHSVLSYKLRNYECISFDLFCQSPYLCFDSLLLLFSVRTTVTNLGFFFGTDFDLVERQQWSRLYRELTIRYNLTQTTVNVDQNYEIVHVKKNTNDSINPKIFQCPGKFLNYLRYLREVCVFYVLCLCVYNVYKVQQIMTDLWV